MFLSNLFTNKVYITCWIYYLKNELSMIVKMGSIMNYIINAPSVPPTGNGMWNLIFAFLNEKYSKERQIFLEKYISTEMLVGPDN